MYTITIKTQKTTAGYNATITFDAPHHPTFTAWGDTPEIAIVHVVLAWRDWQRTGAGD